MKKIIIQFEFPNSYDYDEVVNEINGSITDMNEELANKLSYTILERK